MCNYSDYVFEKGIDEGLQKGIDIGKVKGKAEGIVEAFEMLINNNVLSFEDLSKQLNISVKDTEKMIEDYNRSNKA